MDIQKFTELLGYVAGYSEDLAILEAHEQDIRMRAHHNIMSSHEYRSMSYIYDIICPHETTIQPPETQTRNSESDDDDDDMPELEWDLPSQPGDI